MNVKLNLEVPKEAIRCLCQAVNAKGREFADAAAKERSAHRLAGKPFAPDMKEVVEAWDRRAQALYKFEADIKRQAGVG